MANVPDYISLGYDEDRTEFKVKGTPIWLEINVNIVYL